MKGLINRIMFSKPVAKKLLKPILRLHSWCYNMAGKYAVISNNGVHPKHNILKYEEWFLEHIDSDQTILDVGCKTGMLSFMLAEKAAFVYGIEINHEDITAAREQHARANIEYICTDATTYNYHLCQPINCVTMSNVLEHIEHRIDFLKEVVQRIKWADEDHKRFLLRVPMIDRGWIVLYKKELGLDYRLDPTHRIEYTLEQFEEELRQANIVPKKVEVRFGEIYALCEAVS